MILELYIAFFILASIFLLIGIKIDSAVFVYLAMGLFIFSSLVMANEGIDIITGTMLTENESGTVIQNTYNTLTMDNNIFVMTYVYLFLILPIVGILASISLATKNMRN